MSTSIRQAGDQTPVVEITQVGRWKYSLSGVVDDMLVWMRPAGDRVYGRRRAERRARKRLAQYRLLKERQAAKAVMTEPRYPQ